MKIDKNLLIIGGAAAVGLYFLWPKIKENFSFNTVKAPLQERVFPGKNVFPVEGKSFPGLGNAYGSEQARGIGYAYGHDITQGRGPHLA